MQEAALVGSFLENGCSRLITSHVLVKDNFCAESLLAFLFVIATKEEIRLLAVMAFRSAKDIVLILLSECFWVVLIT